MTTRSFVGFRNGLRLLLVFLIGASVVAVVAASAWRREHGSQQLFLARNISSAIVDEAVRAPAKQRRLLAEARMTDLGGKFSCDIWVPTGHFCCLPSGPGGVGLDLKSTKVTNDDLALLHEIPDLEDLNLASTAIDDRGIRYLRHLSKLTCLCVSGTGITDKGLKNLASVTNLRILYLGDTAATLKGVEELERDLPQLRVLSSSPPSISWELGPQLEFGQVIVSPKQTVHGVLQPFITSGSSANIRELRILGTTLAAGEVAQIAQLPSLARLFLQDVKLSAERLEPLARSTGLKELDLDGSAVYNADLAPIAKLVNLRRLHLGRCPISTPGMEHLRPLTELELLDLSWTKITNRALAVVSQMHRLETLILYNTGITGEGLRHVRDLMHLKSLELPSGLLGADFVNLQNLTNLETFNLGSATRIIGTDEALTHLGRCKKIKGLNFAFSDVTDAGMKTVASQFPDLSRIMIVRTRVTDGGLAALSQLSNLECIYATETAIGDRGLAHLSKLSKLRELTFRRTLVTEAGLIHLRGLKNLRSLTLPKGCNGPNVGLLESEIPDLMLSND